MPAPARLSLDPRFASHWARLRALVKLIALGFGSVQEIMDWVYPTRKQRRDLLKWLRPLEALARRLTLAEALSLIKREAAALSAPADAMQETKSFTRAPKPRPFRVMPLAQFRVPLLGDRPAHNPDMPPMRALELAHSLDYVVANGHRRRGRLRPAVRLAMRCEALLRLTQKPLPYVRKLALRLLDEAVEAREFVLTCCARPEFTPPRPDLSLRPAAPLRAAGDTS